MDGSFVSRVESTQSINQSQAFIFSFLIFLLGFFSLNTFVLYSKICSACIAKVCAPYSDLRLLQYHHIKVRSVGSVEMPK
jgi:hypothetical protein